MPSQPIGRGKNRKAGNKNTASKPSTTSSTPAAATSQSIIVNIRSSANKDKPTTPEEFGSVWFRNHNPNMASKPMTPNTAVSATSAKISSAPVTVSQLPSRPAPTYDLNSVPPWARYRLPPTTPHPPSSPISVQDETPHFTMTQGGSAMSSNATPFDINTVNSQRLPSHQLYPFTTEGLSTEMFDYVLSMQLTETERKSREALKAKIENVVGMLWPISSAGNEPSNGTSTIPSPFLASSVASMSSASGPATPLPMSLECDLEPSTAAHSKKLSASVILFGSYELGLATPSSDLDLSVVFANAMESHREVITAGDSLLVDPIVEEELRLQRYTNKIPSFECLRLREFAEAIRGYDETIEVRVLEECRVPVAHVIDLPTGISADVSINMPHMAMVVAMQKAWLDEEAAAEAETSQNSKVRALILLTKLALRQWGMGCSFTGGLSSTGVYLLVERYLREGREAGCVSTPLPCLSKLVIDFWLYMSSDMFQQGYLASDVFHISNCKSSSMGLPSYAPSTLSSPREGARSPAPDDYFPTPGVSPTSPDGPQSFPTTMSQGTLTRTASCSVALPDVTRRCTRMGEIQFLFRHSATTLEQLVATGPKNVWSLPITPLSSVLADPRLSIPKRPHTRQTQMIYRPTKATLREGHDGATRSDRSSTPGASSNGSDTAVSPPSVKSRSGSPVKFKSSLKNFVGAACFVPRKLLATPPPSYESLEN